MKVTIGPETIVITNLCHYRHYHYHHIPLWVMEASKLWIFCFEGEEKNVEQVWKKIRFYKKCNCIWRFKLDMQDLLTEMNKNGSLFTPRYVRKIIQISPWPLRFLRSDPWDIGKLGVDGQGPSSFSVPRPLHTSLTSSSSSHYLSTSTLSSSPTSSSRIVINQCFMEKSIRHWFVTIYLFIIVNIMFPWIVTPIVTRWGVSGSLWFRLPQHYQMMNCPTASS